jgi:hypothetical protein
MFCIVVERSADGSRKCSAADRSKHARCVAADATVGVAEFFTVERAAIVLAIVWSIACDRATEALR